MFPGASRFLGAAGLFGGDSDPLPWCDDPIVAGCEPTDLDTEGDDKEMKIMPLCWGLVHSRHPANVERGIMMLLVSVETEGAFSLAKKHYLIAVGHFRKKEYGKSMDRLNICLQIDPQCKQALELKTLLIDKIKKDGTIGICIATGTVGALGFAAGGILGAVGAVTIAASGVLTMVRRT